MSGKKTAALIVLFACTGTLLGVLGTKGYYKRLYTAVVRTVYVEKLCPAATSNQDAATAKKKRVVRRVKKSTARILEHIPLAPVCKTGPPAPCTLPPTSAPVSSSPSVVPPAAGSPRPTEASASVPPSVPPSKAAPMAFVRTTPNTEPPVARHLTPGSAWDSVITSPIEKGNVVNYSHADQGVIVLQKGMLQVEPYAAMNTARDTKGYDWDSRVEMEAGIKTNLNLPRGVITVGAGFANERRHTSTKRGPVVFDTGWFGWDQVSIAPSRKRSPLTLPGSAWWTVGNISPFDGATDLIAVAHVEQGVTVLKGRHVALVPVGVATVGADSAAHPWNNRETLGGGLKLVVPLRVSVISATVGYECTKQVRGIPAAATACGPSAHIDLWTGWKQILGRRY